MKKLFLLFSLISIFGTIAQAQCPTSISDDGDGLGYVLKLANSTECTNYPNVGTIMINAEPFIIQSCLTTPGIGTWVQLTADGNPVPITGAPIVFTVGALTCSYNNSGNLIPVCTTPTAYNVTGSNGVAIGIPNSQTGVNYQLKRDATNVGATIAGTTGSALSYGIQSTAGTYTIVGTTGACTATMTGSVTISGTLPITWLYFTGQAMDNSNVLSWQTVSETNNNGFEIQRSTDVVRFQTIGFVAGKGTTTERQAYQFEDLSPLDQLGEVAYYRLKQVDFDARFEYSRIIAIVRKEQKQVSVFPNPSNGIFTITGIENLNDETFTLINSVGQTLKLRVSATGQMDLSAYPSGVYCLRMEGSGQVIKLVRE
jgi:Tfp pilus assembly protein FimT